MKAPLSQRITRKSASNLAMAFVLLPRPKRAAMSALYAFCREVDDIADEPGKPAEARRRELDRWRKELDRIFADKEPKLPLARELKSTARAYRIPPEPFYELLRGVEMDLEIRRYPDAGLLDLYCYRVASAVGLMSIEIFGYRNPGTREYAVSLGKALQLTNILRDVAVDARRDRIYLPQELLDRFGVPETDILEGRWTENYRRLAEEAAGWAAQRYREAARALPAEDRRNMIAAELMGMAYWKLLQTLRRNRFDVFGGPRPSLSRAAKWGLILRAGWNRFLLPSRPAYG